MKKIILGFIPLLLLAGCGADKKEDTANFAQDKQSSAHSSSSTSTPSSSQNTVSSSEQLKSYPEALEQFSKGDYSSFHGLYKNSNNDVLIITKDHIEYYSHTGKDIGSVIVNESTFKSKTENQPFNQVYLFNQGQIEINFNATADKIETIQITDNAGTTADFTLAAQLDSNNFTKDTVLNYFKSYLSNPDDYYFDTTNTQGSFVIQVFSKEMRANGASGTVGLYKVLPDGTIYLVTYDVATNTYPKAE
ncbi:hypothetical protein ACFSJM_07420 [Lactococcus formosensis subsp. bovis]|uniref:hypothetical protein n=1 Tax=Lactococcus formosensis TaxID=1281486 RepID=UPI001BD1B1AB|nr:hypothetical protein [Lactococcus formosensis]